MCLPHWASIENDVFMGTLSEAIDNIDASVLDMDDTSSCTEIELDPLGHELEADETQPTLLYPSVKIKSSEPLPSILPGVEDQVPR